MPEIKIDETTSVNTNKEKKRSGIAKIGHAIINDDFDKIGDSLVNDILIPAIQNTLASLGKNFIDMLFYGESRGNYSNNASTYHNSYNSNNNNKPTNSFRDTGDAFIFTSSEINSRGDGEAKLYQLRAILDDWGYVNVSNLYSICNETAPYTYDGYGWRSLHGASVGMAPGGQHYIKLPRPIALKKQ